MSDDSPSPDSPAPADAAAASTGEVSFPTFSGGPAGVAGPADLDLVLDVPVELSVEIGRTIMTIRETLEIGPGSIVHLNKMTGDPVDLFVNGRRIARGEVVAIDEEFGLRVTHVVSPSERLDAAG
jgi:flagellar motor switch protein FliN/FliY